MGSNHKSISSFVFTVICFLITRISLCQGSDSIFVNESLSGDQTILSTSGIFRLGFFKPGNSSKYYIGIWYNKVSTQTCVWVANREIGVSDRFLSQLKFVDGNLVLLNEFKRVIWSTNYSNVNSISNNVKAVLQDDGNFVIMRDFSKEILWQSFDYPTHTWLPGGKIRLDKRTNRSQLLTSWKNSEDPSPGLYSLELDPNGTNSYVILWNKSVSYWTSGSWNGEIFSLVPEMRLSYLYNFSFVSNANESYFTYSMYNSSVISRFVMDVSGQVKQLTWLSFTNEWNLFWSQPRTQCEVYAYCGAFGTCNEGSTSFCNCLKGFVPRSENDWNLRDYSGGCVRKIPLNCGNSAVVNGRMDKFTENSNMRSPIRSIVVFVDSFEECKSTCSDNCSCTAYSFSNGACSVWYDDLLDLQQFSGSVQRGTNLHVKVNAAELPDAKKNTGMIIGIVAGSIAVVTILISLIFIVCKKRKRRVKMTKPVEGSLIPFGYKDLQNATKNFSEKLGGGGFGSVFRGTLPDSTDIAVKKLDSVSQGEKQFRTEVSTIGTIQHVNLVRLRGFCSEGTKRLLVYEYMPNGSLDAHLFNVSNSSILDWRTRYQIALGTARGLNYLHEKCRECIIHCDIKPENILLDSEQCPKVADFGLAKLMGREFSRVLTTMRGTRGYLAPEWISGVAITSKADVYSYGMMLFELISGKRNFEQQGDGKIKFFPTHAASKLHEGEDLEIVNLTDYRLKGNVNADEVIKAVKVACWCVQDDENDRPSMGQIVQIFEGVLDVSLPPIPRCLQMFVDDQERLVFFTESSVSRSSCLETDSSTSTSRSKSVVTSTVR